MRIINILFLLIIGCAQNNDTLKVSLRLLQNPPGYQFSTDSTGFSNLKNLPFLSAEHTKIIPAPNSKNIHLVDFNNDGHKDIILQSFTPYSETIVFVNKGTHFKEIWRYAGALVEVISGKETTMYVLKQAIGCDTFSELIQLKISNDNSIAESTLSYHMIQK